MQQTKQNNNIKRSETITQNIKGKRKKFLTHRRNMSGSNGPSAFRKFVKHNNLQLFKKLEYEVRIAN